MATSVAVIAIVGIGFGMLSGRIDLRRGATVIIGGFILFGASSIVAGLEYGTSDGGIYAAPDPINSAA
jgi:type IV secretion system protein VirB2